MRHQRAIKIVTIGIICAAVFFGTSLIAARQWGTISEDERQSPHRSNNPSSGPRNKRHIGEDDELRQDPEAEPEPQTHPPTVIAPSTSIQPQRGRLIHVRGIVQGANGRRVAVTGCSQRVIPGSDGSFSLVASYDCELRVLFTHGGLRAYGPAMPIANTEVGLLSVTLTAPDDSQLAPYTEAELADLRRTRDHARDRCEAAGRGDALYLECVALVSSMDEAIRQAEDLAQASDNAP